MENQFLIELTRKRLAAAGIEPARAQNHVEFHNAVFSGTLGYRTNPSRDGVLSHIPFFGRIQSQTHLLASGLNAAQLVRASASDSRSVGDDLNSFSKTRSDCELREAQLRASQTDFRRKLQNKKMNGGNGNDK